MVSRFTVVTGARKRVFVGGLHSLVIPAFGDGVYVSFEDRAVVIGEVVGQCGGKVKGTT